MSLPADVLAFTLTLTVPADHTGDKRATRYTIIPSTELIHPASKLRLLPAKIQHELAADAEPKSIALPHPAGTGILDASGAEITDWRYEVTEHQKINGVWAPVGGIRVVQPVAGQTDVDLALIPVEETPRDEHRITPADRALAAREDAERHAGYAAGSAVAASAAAGDASMSAAAAAGSASTSSSARAGAETAQQGAVTARTAAESARDAAATARAGAETARDTATTKASAASTSAGEAATSAAGAVAAVADARTARDQASGHASAASTSATAAGQSASGAASDRAAAETAKTGAETARDAAGTHRTAAEAARVGAETARDAAASPKVGFGDVTTAANMSAGRNTVVNGGVEPGQPVLTSVNGLHRLKFAKNATNKWYLHVRVPLGTYGAVKDKRLLIRSAHLDISTDSALARGAGRWAFNIGGDWGPGTKYTEFTLGSAVAPEIAPGLYAVNIAAAAAAGGFQDTDTFNVTVRLFETGATSTVSTYDYSLDFIWRVALAESEALSLFTVLPLVGAQDRSRNATVHAGSFYQSGDAGRPSAVTTVVRDGINHRWTRAAQPNPDLKWDFGIASHYLGRVAELQGMSIALKRHIHSGAAGTSVGLGKNSVQWASVLLTVPATGEWAYFDDAYARLKAAGWADTDSVYYSVGIDSRANPTQAYDFTSAALSYRTAPSSQSYLRADALVGFNPANYVTRTEFDAVGIGRYLTLWGDSLTAGGGWDAVLATLTGLPVYNAGTGGENVVTIMARQGADVMMINNIVIPATLTPVTIATRAGDVGIPTALGKKATPLLQSGSSHVNPVRIGEIEGTLAWTGTAYNDPNGTWTFTRSTAGSQVSIDRPTAIRTKADREWNNGIMVVFMGQNGGYSSDAELVSQHRLMKAHYKGRAPMLVLGLSSGTAAQRAAYETAMRAEFGRYFISLREYLSVYGLADAGLTPTQADLDAMAVGSVPPQLLSDAVHYTAACKTVIGNLVYRRMRELGLV